MTFEARRKDYDRQHIFVVEIDLDYCGLTAGVAPCTATETGDDKCFNCQATCNDLPNYDSDGSGGQLDTVKTYRFVEDRSPHPIGIDAIPSLQSASFTPAQIDLKGGLGVRSKATIDFTDHPHSDLGIDPYITERSYNPAERGTFWTRLRARNPNYQNRNLRVLTGYLEPSGLFDPVNFLTRHYVIDKLDASGGACRITAKDPLKLASQDKAQAPRPSAGRLLADIDEVDTKVDLTPPGVGEEYGLEGKVLISSEVMSYTRIDDTLTVVRAQNNTEASSHSADDTVQECLEYDSVQVHVIVNDLLTNYANISTDFIPLQAWEEEVNTFLAGFISGIIVKPFDVWKLLKELSEAMPHYLWWDERTQNIQLTALKAPPLTANPLDMESNIIADSFRTVDKPEMRLSTIFVYFGQINPTLRLDEPANWQQTYVRLDTDSVSKYGSQLIKTIFCRWFTAFNAAGSRQLAALIGRRFADVPREIQFDLDPKDGDVWIGQSRNIIHRDITGFDGLPTETTFQIISSNEADNYKYKALEYTYGDELPEDEGGGEPGVTLVIISIDALDVNLRTVYDGLFPAPSDTTRAKFVIERNTVLGSSSTATYGIDTGTWPAGAEVTLDIKETAFIVGMGGNGQDRGGSPAATDGGPALILNHDLILINDGIIGGGGGGGRRTDDPTGIQCGGGGGAGSQPGTPQGSRQPRQVGGWSFVTTRDSEDGNLSTGGAGAYFRGWRSTGYQTIVGGTGRALGQPAITGSGNPGNAINRNGYNLTGELGDIRGDIVG